MFPVDSGFWEEGFFAMKSGEKKGKEDETFHKSDQLEWLFYGGGQLALSNHVTPMKDDPAAARAIKLGKAQQIVS